MEYAAKPTARYQQVLDRIPVIGDVVRSPMGALGLFIVVGFLFVVLFAPYIAPYHYTEQDIPSRLEGPSRQYPLGTDELGRDLLSRLIYGSRIALGVAIPSVAIALTGGVLLGLFSGYVGGLVDDVVVVFIDSINAFPAVILALAVLALLGPALTNEILVIGLAWIPGYARVTRAQTLSVKQNVYIEAERSLGASTARIILFHVMPNVVAPVLILAAMDLPVVITFEAGLSFLGLGVPPPFPSWGSILATGFNFVRQSPWPITWAGLTLIVTTLGFTLFGEALRDVLDPRLSGTRGIR
ncbi:MAG: ABC transporter permease [Candidatus Promineifilaceae bacterium]|nr:ABC transporter permease [Candidatus Promineifilaceae bacterium]